jgi:hypothetical protein
VLVLDLPLFMLEVFSRPSGSTIDSYEFFDLDGGIWLPPLSLSQGLRWRSKAWVLRPFMSPQLRSFTTFGEGAEQAIFCPGSQFPLSACRQPSGRAARP